MIGRLAAWAACILVAIVVAAVAAIFLVAPSLAFAALGDDPILRAPAQAADRKIGWTPKASVGANAAFASSKNVVGQTEGTSETYGLASKGTFDWAGARDDWRNSFSYSGSLARTAALPRFVKSLDDARLESLYMRAWEDGANFGPYGRLATQTSLFPGEDARSAPVVYQIARRDGSTQTVTGDSLRLTDPFHPLTLKESVGMFWKPVESKGFRLDLRAGVGAQQIAADGQYALTGSAATAVSATELRSLSQAGLEAAVVLKGEVDEKSSYEAGVESLTPVAANKEANDSRDAWRLTNVEGFAKFSTKVTSWAYISYEYRLQSKPQLLDAAQQTHLALLNIQYDLF